jgi:acetyl esterase/lipase
MGPRIPVPRIDWIDEKKLDVPYGGDPLQKMDVYYPNEKKPVYPALILVHGGGFIQCDKRDWHLYPGFHALAEGFALVSVNYRLSPKNPYPAAIEDLKNAVAFLRKNSASLLLDHCNFFLYGTSAGGNLVSITGLDGAASAGTERDYHVNAVAALCPLINFENYFIDPGNRLFALLPPVRSAFRRYLGAMPAKDPGRIKAADADSHIAPGAPAFYIQHGEDDRGVSPNQSVNFYQKLKQSGFLPEESLVLDIMPGVRHAGDGPEYLEPEHVKPILAFFKKHIRMD